MKSLQELCKVNKIGPLRYRLGCDYVKDADGIWYIGTKTYSTECISCVENILNKKMVSKATQFLLTSNRCLTTLLY